MRSTHGFGFAARRSANSLARRRAREFSRSEIPVSQVSDIFGQLEPCKLQARLSFLFSWRSLPRAQRGFRSPVRVTITCICRTPRHMQVFFAKKQTRSSKIELRAIFVPIHLHLSSTNAFPKTLADHIPFASVLKTNIHDIIFGFFPIRLHSVGVIP